MSEEIRKVLQALQRGEISQEEAEALIEAIKMREEKKETEQTEHTTQWRIIGDEYAGDISTIGENIWIKPGGKVLGHVDIVSGKLKLEGLIDGNLSAVASQVEFGGIVSGSVELVGSTIYWKRGEIKGNLEIVGTKEKGQRVSVGGKVETLAGPIGAMVSKVTSSAINMAMNLIGSLPEKLANWGKGTTGGFSGNADLTLTDNMHIHSNIYANTLTVAGDITCEDVKVKHLIVSGTLHCDDVSADTVEIGGTLRCDDITGNFLRVDGSLSCDDVRFDKITVNGNMMCDDIHTTHMEVSGKVKADDISGNIIIVSGELYADDIVATKVILKDHATVVAKSISATDGIEKADTATLKIKEESPI